jgi:CheY-like chemotaxis protein
MKTSKVPTAISMLKKTLLKTFRIRRTNHFINTFITQIVHELRNNLNSVHYIAQSLKKEIKLDNNLKKIAPYVDNLHIVVNSMSNIVSNALEMTKIETGKQEEINEEHFLVHDFFDRLVAVYKIQAKARNLQLQLSIDANMPEVIISDTLQLYHITTNLLVNAIQHAHANSTVVLKVSRQADEWSLGVINNGIIIPPEKQTIIFRQFETSTPNRLTEDSHIGLSIVKRKIKALHGSIALESRDEAAIIFMAKFALKEGQKENIPEETIAQDYSDVNVLVVDDDEMGRTLIANFFTLSGCRVKTAGNGREAIAVLEQTKQLPDAIIMDHHMPEMSGLEALKYLKKDPLLKQIPVIICTGDPLHIDAFKTVGAVDVLIKPVMNIRPILAILSQHLSRVYEM